MALTNFPNGISSMGVPVVGGQGLLTQGNSYFVDPANGLDSNDGLSVSSAVQTLSQAHTLCTTGQNDVVYYLSGSTSTSLATTLTWSKSYTHLVGICAPVPVAQRARVFTSAAFTPMWNITGSGCIFENLYFFHGQDSSDAEICTQVTGQRNYFHNVHFAGIGHATQGDDTGARSLLIAGGAENMFEDCTIGVDTIARSGANAEIGFTTQATRNHFRNCRILSYADNSGHLFVHADAASTLDRYVLFENCLFYNAIGSAATQMTGAIAIHASAGGLILLKGCQMVGATDWEVDDNNTCYIDVAGATGITSGLMVVTDVS